METLFLKRTKEIGIERANLEKKLQVKLTLEGRKLTIEGDPYKEYEAKIILEAINFGFSVSKALLLLEEEILFRRLHIKSFTRRKNLHEVRARLIGTYGKTKNTIEEISGCEVVIQDNEVGIIGSAESIEHATTAIKNIIRGTKQANAYRYLERMNRTKDIDDLGIKTKKDKE